MSQTEVEAQVQKLRFRMKIYALVGVGALLAAFAAHADELCPATYAKALNGLEALDHEFAEVLKTEPGKAAQAPAVIALLNRSFFPMMEALSKSARELKPEQIEAKLSRLEGEKPIFTSAYVGDVAKVEHASSFESVVAFNAKTVKDFYGLNQNPDIAKAANYLYVAPDADRVQRHGTVAGQLELVLTPEGEYGRKFSENLLRTTEILFEIADQNLREISGEVYRLNPQLLAAEAARVKGAAAEQAKIEEAPLTAMIEGIMSFQQLLTLVLSEKIPGVETGAQALEYFVNGGTSGQGLTSDLTFRIPMAVVGPAALSGYSFKGALELDANHKLQMTEVLKKNLNALKDKQVAASGGRKGVCPMASFWRKPKALQAEEPSDPDLTHKTGLQILADTYLRVFKVVEKQHPSTIP